MYNTGSKPPSICSILSKDLNYAADWAAEWGKLVNAEKSEHLAISTRKSDITSPPVTLSGTQIPQVTSHVHKHLGVNFNNTLSWHQHVDKVYTSCARRIAIKRLRRKLHPVVLKRIYLGAVKDACKLLQSHLKIQAIHTPSLFSFLFFFSWFFSLFLFPFSSFSACYAPYFSSTGTQPDKYWFTFSAILFKYVSLKFEVWSLKDEMGSQIVSSESNIHVYHQILVYLSRNNNSQAQARRFPALTAPEPEFPVIFGSKWDPLTSMWRQGGASPERLPELPTGVSPESCEKRIWKWDFYHCSS